MRKWLRAIRTKTGYSQEEVAVAIGVTQPSYSNIENGERRPSPEVAQKLAEFLGGFEWTRFYTKEEADN